MNTDLYQSPWYREIFRDMNSIATKVESLRVGDAVIEEIDVRKVSDHDAQAINVFDNVLRAESHPSDPPTPVELTAAGLRNIPDFANVRMFLARDTDGSIAASGNAGFLDTEENKHLVQVSIGVRRDRRRQGIGKALLGLALGVAEANGRTLLVGNTAERVPAGEAFAQRMGAEPASAVHTNRLVLEEVDRDLVRRWIDEGPGRAPGYSLVWVDGVYPDDIIDEIVDVMHVMNDAPRDNLQMEDQHFTPEQFREMEKGMVAVGLELWSLFARHDSTGQLVGLTHVSWLPAQPDTIMQGNTGLRPEHRGHALGKWLKAVMLERILKELPAAVDIRTGNADSNDAMLGINRELGFKPYMPASVWQITADRVRQYLDEA
ncbi:MAG: GNAT family N-acetyltransferase [Gammaproteobacteria bacterium]